jgi:hypothetical protein
LAAGLGPEGRIEIGQTWHEVGGTHLYARTSDREWHIARNGHAFELGVAVDSANAPVLPSRPSE